MAVTTVTDFGHGVLLREQDGAWQITLTSNGLPWTKPCRWDDPDLAASRNTMVTVLRQRADERRWQQTGAREACDQCDEGLHDDGTTCARCQGSGVARKVAR